MLTRASRNLFDRLTAVESVVMGDGIVSIDRANKVVVITGNGAPTDGAEGTGYDDVAEEQFAGPGSLYIDYTNAKVYINTNTLAIPYWVALGHTGS
jgi:hypothetical protein